ncbi:unnamed protein product [Ixodes pacificus]
MEAKATLTGRTETRKEQEHCKCRPSKLRKIHQLSQAVLTAFFLMTSTNTVFLLKNKEYINIIIIITSDTVRTLRSSFPLASISCTVNRAGQKKISSKRQIAQECKSANMTKYPTQKKFVPFKACNEGIT